jgi:O-antigen ligase
MAAAMGLFLLTGGIGELAALRWRAVHTAMTATVVWTLWSALGHDSLATSYGTYALLDRIVMPFLLFTLAPILFAEERDRQLLLRTLTVLGIYLGATAVFEVLGPSVLVFPRYIMDPTAGILFGRARGPFVEAEADGMVLACCLFAALLSVTRSRGRWRIASAAAAALTSVGALLTLTRSIWVGTVVGALVVIVIVPPLRRRIVAILAGAAAVVGALLLVVPGLTTTLLDRLTTERSVYDRQNVNAAALRAIAAHPVDGVGWMQWLGQSTDWVRQADTYPVTKVTIEIHNVVLSRAAELGLVGAGLWVACVLAGPVLAMLRRPTEASLEGWHPVFVGYACVWGVCIMLSPVPYVLPNNLFWLIGGMILRDHLVTARSSAAPTERLAPA